MQIELVQKYIKIIEPALQQVAPETTGQANRHLDKLDSNYNNIKNKVLDAHGQAENHINDIWKIRI